MSHARSRYLLAALLALTLHAALLLGWPDSRQACGGGGGGMIMALSLGLGGAPGVMPSARTRAGPPVGEAPQPAPPTVAATPPKGSAVTAPEAVTEPEPEPTPAPEPVPTPEPEPAPTPDSEPKPEPKPAPAPEPAPVPEPLPESAPVPGPEPAPTPEPKHALAPEPAPAPSAVGTSAPEGSPAAAGTGMSAPGAMASAGSGGGPPAADRGDADAKRIDAYLAMLRSLLEAEKEYPRRARLRRRSGVVRLAFAIGADGRVVDAWVAESSGYMVLDRAAVELLARVAPFPPPPPGVSGAITVEVPIAYRLR